MKVYDRTGRPVTDLRVKRIRFTVELVGACQEVDAMNLIAKRIQDGDHSGLLEVVEAEILSERPDGPKEARS